MPELPGKAIQFIESILTLKPAIAVFDCDGTLWSGDAGADFFYWEIERGLVSREVAERERARYKEYEAGKVGEEQMCNEMVTMNRGISNEVLQRAAGEFFEQVVRGRIFPEMQELTRRLAAQGCDVWAVSSTNNWVVNEGSQHFSIAADRVLAACAHLENGHVSDRIIRVPTGDQKVAAISQIIGRPVDAAFGNSVHDQAMLETAKYPFCVNPNRDLERIATERGWSMYWPGS